MLGRGNPQSPETPKLESTVRYLGVEVDDALELSQALEL